MLRYSYIRTGIDTLSSASICADDVISSAGAGGAMYDGNKTSGLWIVIPMPRTK